VEKATAGSGLRWPGSGGDLSRRELILRVIEAKRRAGRYFDLQRKRPEAFPHGGLHASPIISAGSCSRLGRHLPGRTAFRNLMLRIVVKMASPPLGLRSGTSALHAGEARMRTAPIEPPPIPGWRRRPSVRIARCRSDVAAARPAGPGGSRAGSSSNNPIAPNVRVAPMVCRSPMSRRSTASTICGWPGGRSGRGRGRSPRPPTATSELFRWAYTSRHLVFFRARRWRRDWRAASVQHRQWHDRVADAGINGVKSSSRKSIANIRKVNADFA